MEGTVQLAMCARPMGSAARQVRLAQAVAAVVAVVVVVVVAQGLPQPGRLAVEQQRQVLESRQRLPQLQQLRDPQPELRPRQTMTTMTALAPLLQVLLRGRLPQPYLQLPLHQEQAARLLEAVLLHL